MPQLFPKFASCSHGSTGTLFALLAVPVLLAVGAAVDYGRLFDRQTELTSALDGAVLAAASATTMSTDERVALAKKYFADNFKAVPGDNVTLEVSLSENSVKANAKAPVPTFLMRLGGIDSMDAIAATEVMLPSAGKAEVVLVLDYSGSMLQSGKYARMAEAADEMVTKLGETTEAGNLKVGLVPFSAMVRTTMNAGYVSQGDDEGKWTGCTQDRRYPLNTTVDTPTSDSASKWGYFDNSNENKGAYDCSSYAAKSLNILPLTTDLSKVKSQLAAMRPLGNTNIPLGAEFGWNLLDKGAPFDEAVDYTDPVTRKYLVLLTDGVQTSKQWGPGNSRNVEHGQKNLIGLCSAMRAKGITVFAIAYDITDKKVTSLLKECAPGKYFEPDAGGESISLVFNEITGQISNDVVRLVK